MATVVSGMEGEREAEIWCAVVVTMTRGLLKVLVSERCIKKRTARTHVFT